MGVMSVGSHMCQGDQNHCNILVGQATSARAVAISQWSAGEPEPGHRQLAQS